MSTLVTKTLVERTSDEDLIRMLRERAVASENNIIHNLLSLAADRLSARLTPPAEVVRYGWVRDDEADGGRDVLPTPDGEYVRYEDHTAALAASAAREAHWRDQASAWESLASTAEATLGTETEMRKEADARAKAEAELRATAWARVERAEAALAATRAVPADVVLETTAERRKKQMDSIGYLGKDTFIAQLLRDHDTLTAALAASEAKRKEAEAEETHRVSWMMEALRQTAGLAADPMPATGDLGVDHIRDMPERVMGFSAAKLGRWLGWAQAAVVAGGRATLDDMKHLNKRCSDAALDQPKTEDAA